MHILSSRRVGVVSYLRGGAGVRCAWQRSSVAFGARVCECGEEGPTKAHGLLLITCNLFHGQSQKEIHTLYPGSRELLLYIYACPHALGLRICNVQCLGSKCQRELDGAARKWSVTDSPGIYSGFASPAAFGPKDRVRSVTHPSM